MATVTYKKSLFPIGCYLVGLFLGALIGWELAKIFSR